MHGQRVWVVNSEIECDLFMWKTCWDVPFLHKLFRAKIQNNNSYDENGALGGKTNQ